jgi:parallel beta-helix repeat protein
MTKSDFFNNTLSYNGGGPSAGWEVHLDVQSCEMLQIYGNIFDNLKPDSVQAVTITWCSNITFHNNTLLNNGDFTVAGQVRVDLGSGDTNVRFLDNNISYNAGRGLMVYGQHYPENSVVVKNNFIYQNTGSSLELFRMQNYTVTNNTFVTSSTIGVFVDDCADGEFSNNTVAGSFADIAIRDSYGDDDDTYFVVTNCSLDPQTTWIMSDYPDIMFQWYLHVYVEDLLGPAPDVDVEVFDNTMSKVFQGKTDGDGWIRFITITNQTMITPSGGLTVTTYFDPHNITATNSGDTAYGVIEPIMDHSQVVNVYFTTDLLPEDPKDLTAVSSDTDVYLSWTPSHSTDLDYYEIYRNNTVGGWALLDTWGSPSYTDPLAASDWSTYRYRIRAVDQIGQLSGYSNTARCGDWAINDTRLYSDITVVLNGSFIVLSNGDVTLRHVQLEINCSYPGEHGVQVKPGGRLAILDNDDDHHTTNDQSNITAKLNTNKMTYTNFYMRVEGDWFEMRNSKLFKCGSDTGLTYTWWYLDDQGLKVIDKGEPWRRGMYLGPTVTWALILNNNLTENFVSVLVEGAQNAIILNNNISRSMFGVYLHNTQLTNITYNNFTENLNSAIYIYDSDFNTVHNNNITNPSSGGSIEKAGITIIGRASINNLIFFNDIIYGDYGILIYESGVDNELWSNNIYLADYGLNVFNTTVLTLLDNNFQSHENGIVIDYSDQVTIKGGIVNGTGFAYYIMNSGNVTISDVSISENFGGGIVGIYAYNLRANNVTISTDVGGFGGVAFLNGDIIILDNITIEGFEMGFYSVWGAQNILMKNSFITNVGESVYSEECADLAFENTTLEAAGLIFNITTTSIISINSTFDQSKVLMDNSSSIAYYWYVHIKVLDWLGSPVPGAQVEVRKVFGTLIHSGTTDGNGYIRDILIHERTQFVTSNETSNPHSVQAVYGNHSGTLDGVINQTLEVIVYLENTAPTASNVIIAPTYPTTVDDLTLTYLYTDPENDPEGGTQILWYINGMLNPAYTNLLTINSAFTSKDETWFCEVYPHDGTVFGASQLSTPVTIQNTPPEVTNVTIQETAPSSSDSLHVAYDYFDLDNDPEGFSLHRWYFWNGSGWEYSGQDAIELSSIYTQKGDRWRCIVQPSDGDDLGTARTSPMRQIGNTAPEASDAVITPTSPKSNETLGVSYTYYDLDSDSENGSIIQWFMDSVEQIDLNGSTTVDPSRTTKGEKWFYIVTPMDGEDYGVSVISESVIIENSPPEVSGVSVIPGSPDTSDDLTVQYDFYDEDGDSESQDTIIKWLKWSGIDFIDTGFRGQTLSSAFTTKGEEWTCEITPHDGLNYGITLRCSESYTIANSKPTVDNLLITPTDPTTNTDLAANYDYSDLDGDLENGTEIIWFRNGGQVSELDDYLTVSHNFTQKGDIWYFSVHPFDGSEFGNEMSSHEVTIENNPPSAEDVFISPGTPLGDDSLAVSYTYLDDDDDPEDAPEIRWYKNGLPQTLYNDETEVDSDATEKGELWYYTIRVNDGEEYSEEIDSQYVVIENSRPVVTSISPSPGQRVLNETESMEFFVEVEDPDGDLLLIKWKLGKTTVADDEYYLFETDYESAGVYTLNLTIQDVGERSFTLSFEWELTVGDINLLPEIEIKEPLEKNSKMDEGDTLKFLIEESDPDTDDTLMVTWYFDEVVAQTGGSSYAYTAGGQASGDHQVRVVVDDGTDNMEYTWNVSVSDKGLEEFLGYSYDWWGLVLAIGSGVAALLLALIGLIRVKRKKGALKKYMTEIDELSKDTTLGPEEYEMKLSDIEARINDEFKQGLIEDLHYLMLQDLVASKRGEARKAEVSSMFGRLPAGVVKDLDNMLKDGKITPEEYEGFVATISMTESLTPEEKDELSKVIEKWGVEDDDITSQDSQSVKDKIIKDELDEIQDDETTSLEKED